jgi:integrase
MLYIHVLPLAAQICTPLHNKPCKNLAIMATVKLVFDTRTAKKDGTFPVKLSVYHKTMSYLGLDISVKENQWSGNDIVDHPKAKFLNGILKLKLNQAETMLINLKASGRLKKLSQSDLIYFITTNSTDEPEKKAYLLEDHFCKYIANCKAQRTAEIYQETLDKIKTYSPGSAFDEVNLVWLRAFDNYLAGTCGTNTRSIHMRNIRAVFNDAINEDLVSLNLYPFRKFKIKTERTIKYSLTADQIKQLRDYPVQKHQERYRDIFMLIFYLIGINLVDLLRLRQENMRNGRIDYIRAKTGRPYSIEVLPEALAIIDKYKGNAYLLDVLDSYKNYKDFGARMNENLKEIGPLDMVKNKAKSKKFVKNNKKKITPLFPDLIVYTARRSWATIASSIDIQKDTISAALGHQTGSRTTDLYIDFDLKKVDKANRDILTYLNS